MSEPVPQDDREPRSQRESSLEIVHAQYHSALKLAARSESAERAGAFSEARRLLHVAVALRDRIVAQDVRQDRNSRGSGAPRAGAPSP